MDEQGHVPVLLAETLELLAPGPGQVAVDCTVGLGGHAAALAKAVHPAPVIGFDLDPANLAAAGSRIAQAGGRLTAIHDTFIRAPERVAGLGVRADVVLADLGFSSNQMDDPDRGLSFRAEGPLDMRLDPDGPVTAADLLATRSERELADLVFRYGEEPLARKIARKLAQARQRKPIQTTTELVQLILEVYGGRARASRMHPATRTFMALRIAVNDELGALEALLDAIRTGAERRMQGGMQGEVQGGWIKPGARVAIISFHSLEDRLVKRAFIELERRGLCTRLTKKPVAAGASEVQANARSRSARLRAVRIDDPTRE